MPVANKMNPPTIGIISSHRTVGVIPLASVNTITAMKFMPRLNAAVSDTDSGIAIRGNRILRSSDSRASRQVTLFDVASTK